MTGERERLRESSAIGIVAAERGSAPSRSRDGEPKCRTPLRPRRPPGAGIPGQPGDNPADKKATQALIFSIIGLLCCIPLAVLGLVFANQAQAQGATNGRDKPAKIIAIIAIALWAVGLVLNLLVFSKN
ncbi:MAG: hypothetical protein U0Q15_18790 [Kineosporiaceae bacterium]